jgi:hypothetical protein
MLGGVTTSEGGNNQTHCGPLIGSKGRERVCVFFWRVRDLMKTLLTVATAPDCQTQRWTATAGSLVPDRPRVTRNNN